MYNHYNIIKTIIFTFLFSTLFIAFFFNENSSGGAYPDFLMRTEIINSFNTNFLSTFLNYDNYPDRHSPIILIIISLLLKTELDLDSIRFLHLFLVPILIIVSYNCFITKFGKKYNTIFFLIASTIFLSPTIRSISIWPDSRLLGLLLFLSSLFFFLKFMKKQKFRYTIYNTLLLVASSYVSPNFAVFFFYFFYFFFKHYSFSNRLYLILGINLILSLPMFFYLIVLDVNFLSTMAVDNINLIERLNPANKILIISSMIFFYSIPFLFTGITLTLLKKRLDYKNTFITLIIFFVLAYFFTYSIRYTGGGFFFKLSFILFESKYFFLIISFISLFYISNFFKLNLNNILIFMILIFSNPHLTIYHKYYDPLLMILFFTLFEFNLDIKKLLNKKLVINFYIFSGIFLVINLLRFIF